LGIFAPLLIPYAYLVSRFWFVNDDAFISFRFARNLAQGNGLRFNPGTHQPVEGYSNFLWVIYAAVYEAVGLSPTFWLPLTSALCGAGLLFLVFATMHRRLNVSVSVAALATATLATFPPFAVWSTSGLETMPFALTLFIAFDRLILRPGTIDVRGAAAAGIVIALLRVEGILWFVVLVGLAALSRRARGQPAARPCLQVLGSVGAVYGLYSVWRISYHGQLLPNTIYVKSGLPISYLGRGLNYVAAHWLTFPGWLAFIVASPFALAGRHAGLALPVIAMACAFPAFAVVTTGDFMPMGRLLVPGFAFQVIIVAWMLTCFGRIGRWGAAIGATLAVAVIALNLPPTWDSHLVPSTIREQFSFRARPHTSEYQQWEIQRRNTERWSQLGRALGYGVSDPEGTPSYVAYGIGAVGYWSDFYIWDRCGLVLPAVAAREMKIPRRWRMPGHDRCVGVPHFLQMRPTILRARLFPRQDTRRILRNAHEWSAFADSQGLRHDYVLDLTSAPSSDKSLLRLRRIDPRVGPREEWRRWDSTAAELLESVRASAASR
jgi:hypothetical protein